MANYFAREDSPYANEDFSQYEGAGIFSDRFHELQRKAKEGGFQGSVGDIVSGAWRGKQQVANQQQFAKQFRAGMPAMQSRMAQMLTSNANRQLGGDLNAVQGANSRRGLGYGGINEGMKQQTIGQSRARTAGQIASANKGLEDQASQIESGAIKAGFDMQAQQQQMQNMMYEQAMAQNQAQSQMFGSLAGLGLLGGMAYFAKPAASAAAVAGG